VGFDEPGLNPELSLLKILKSIDNIKSALSCNGTFTFTIPLGHNKDLDAYLLEQCANNSLNIWGLKRVSKVNSWIEVSPLSLSNSKYNYPYPAANGVLVVEIKK
jgi:hypothetical protein